MTSLALVRHGQSEWNLENRFTGWVDVDLSDRGRKEAKSAGALLSATGVDFAAAYTSVLKRAIHTLWIALDEMDRAWLGETKSWRLNERHYGGLTGLDKAETAKKYGDDQVKIWRRSFDVAPPPLSPDSPYDPAKDPRYAGLAPAEIPRAESLKSTLARVEPYWTREIAPKIAAGQSLIVSAHGNSLRAIVKLLLDVSDRDIVGVEIPTGNPLMFEFAKDLSPRAARYLDAERAEALPPLPSR